MKTVAVLTPTYNRGYVLGNLYDSLKKQTNFDFVWYIVDDGSNDDTEKVVDEFQKNNFDIVYLKKENGGKHTACNLGFSKITEELTFIVDSDDCLSNDAIENIITDWSKYKDESIGGLSYHRMRFNGDILGDKYVGGDVVISSFIDMRINNNVRGDSAEVYRTDILREISFPEFRGENFLSEAILWIKISLAGYKLVYISKGIYYCKYLNDGLTSQGRIKQLINPKGTLLHAKMHIVKEVRFAIRCKYMLMYIAIAKFAGVSYKEAFNKVDSKILFATAFLPAMLLKRKWEKMINHL